jgi:FkbM family methyltransferase
MRKLLNRLPLTRFRVSVARILYVLVRFVLRRDRFLISRAGIRYDVDISEGLDLSLFLFGALRRRVTISKQLEIPDHAVVVEVGANAGFMTLKFAKLATNGLVYAFEPTHYGFARLKRNLDRNPELAERVVAIQSFVSDGATATSSLTAYSSWSLRRNKGKKRHPIHCGIPGNTNGVGAITLDEFFAQRGIGGVDIIKIDTDGYEIEVLRGARGVIENCRPKVIFEVGLYILEEKGIRFDLFHEYFSSLGYRTINESNGRTISAGNFEKEIPARATIDVLALPVEGTE